MSVESTIVCDKCSAILASRRTAALARDEARYMGAKTGLPGGRDLCRGCA